jgi:hypothetical protein
VVTVIVGDVRGLMLSLPAVGVYQIGYNASDGTAASLCHDNVPQWTIGNGESFFDVGKQCETVPVPHADVTAIIVVGAVCGVVCASAAIVLVVALSIRKERIARAERERLAEVDGLNMQSLAGTDYTFYE